MFITETIPGIRVAENEGLPRLVSRCPFNTRPFPYPELPFPINQVLFGGWPNVGVLLKNVKEAYNRNVYHVLDEALALAECIESQSIDMARRAMSPEAIAAIGHPPEEHRGGWVLLLGSGDRKAMAEALRSMACRVFTLGAGVPGAENLGSRDTAIVYFAQALLARAMSLEEIEPGDIGALCEFLERRTPAAIVVTGPTKPVEQVLVASLLRMGVPAVTPPEFPFGCGRVAYGEEPAEVLEHLSHLPTARTAFRKGELVSLPLESSLDYVDETFQARYKFGGQGSFFHVTTGTRKSGTEVRGEVSQSLGVTIRLGGLRPDEVMLSVIETRLASLIDQLPGLRCVGNDPLEIEATRKDALDGRQLAELIYAGVRIHFERIPSVFVTVTFDNREREALLEEVTEERAARAKRIRAIRESEEDFFYACGGCYSIADRHCCIVTPEHPPLCGLSWEEIKTIAELTPAPQASAQGEFRSFRPPVTPFRRGRVTGKKERGEYAGVNEMLERVTGGDIEKVWLHSLLVNPPPTSARFEVLLFNMRGVEGVGMADSDYQGLTPEGRSVRQLAFDATGMQRPGVRGVSYRYLFSDRFLEVDGGWSSVKWINARLKERLQQDGITAVRLVATEHDATTDTQLEAFYARRRRSRKQAASKARETRKARESDTADTSKKKTSTAKKKKKKKKASKKKSTKTSSGGATTKKSAKKKSRKKS